MSRGALAAGARARVLGAVRAEALRPAPTEVEALVAALRERYGDALVGALFYGSCRARPDAEGVIDLHVVVRDLATALGPWSAAACRALPPNVYYLEVPHAGRVVRSKYAVLSWDQFRRGCSRRAFHSYFWARYAQPLTLVGFEDPEPVVEAIVEAVETLAVRAMPRLGPVTDAHALWVGALRLCYRAELRPEDGERAEALVAAYPDYYRATGEAVLAESLLAQGSPVWAGAEWGARIALGKALSLARLAKGVLTFEGGVDYLAWKLERHTGRRVEVPERVRRRPLLFAWPLLWRLWREGTFR